MHRKCWRVWRPNCFISDELARKIFAKADTFKNYSRTAVLKALASNPKTPADILNRLAEEKDLAILRELASNPHLTAAAMVKLAPFPDCRVRKKIICSPGCIIRVVEAVPARS